MSGFNVEVLRQQFPILQQQVNGHDLIYFDNAATTQKPVAVLDVLTNYYRTINANVHRSGHSLAEQATHQFEQARQTVADFLHAASASQIVWTRGTTEAINLVAYAWAENQLHAGDEVIISAAEHHANFVPWQQLALRKNVVLRVIPLDDQGLPDQQAYQQLLNEKTKLVALAHVSNVTGLIHPIEVMIQEAKKWQCAVLIDGAQAVAHVTVDVQALGCDFYVFSGHKMYAPNGIGALYIHPARLSEFRPWQFGGEMIRHVSTEQTTFNVMPYLLEAGTPAIAEAIALAEAIRWLKHQKTLGIEQYEQELLQYLQDSLAAIERVSVIGSASARIPVLSLKIPNVHPFDLAEYLDGFGIAARSGSHCAMPFMQHLGLSGTLRISLAAYNTVDEIDRFIRTLKEGICLLDDSN